jgi:hypothetical protein
MPERDKKLQIAAELEARTSALGTLLNAKTSEYGAMLMLGRYKEASELRDAIHTMLDAALDMAEEAYRNMRKTVGLDNADGTPKSRD